MLKNLLQIRNSSTLVRQAKSLLVNARTFTTKETKNTAQEITAEDEAPKTKKHKNPFARERSEDLLELPPVNTVPAPELSDEERQRRLKVLQLEVDIAHQEGRRVPQLDFISDHQWEYILTLPTKSARGKYYGYLWQIAMKREGQERKKAERAAYGIEHKEAMRREREENTHIVYGLGHTSLFLRIYDSTINHWQNNRLTRAMQFSPKIVLDCSYDQYMTRREAINTAKQLTLCFAENRAHDDPFDLHYCNVHANTTSIQSLQRYMPTMYNPEFPMNVHEKSFTELFPKENLVYLTPHCRNDLEAYNPDDIYIIGAMVDTVNNDPLSLAKAKKQGLRMARLPLDRYLQWGAGSGKSLTLNQMINIMLDLKSTGDWMKSLSHVPRRKIADMSSDGTRHRQSMYKRAERLNVRVDRMFDEDDKGYGGEESAPGASKVRSRKDDLQFNLQTWGSKKKNRN